jgi:superfamily II DNA or RNA helicase
MEVYFTKINETYYEINCERSVLQELNEHFSFLIPNHRFHPKVKSGYWDGKIRLINLRERLIYVGLKDKLKQFCDDREYTSSFDDTDQPNPLNKEKAIEFVKSLNIPSEYEIRDYQIEYFLKSVNHTRNLSLLATSGGKTTLIYYLYRYFGVKTLIITPMTGLVTQIPADFKDYGLDVTTDTFSKNNLLVKTWQSIQHIKDQEWYDQWDMVIVDEVHTADAAKLSKIMERMTYAKYRFGFTGTLKDSKSSEMSLIGLFGPITKEISTVELIEQGYLAQLKIKAITLKYNEADRKTCSKRPYIDDMGKKKSRPMTYQDEVDFILSHEGRNDFIKNLVLSLKGNTLVLFKFKSKHGLPLFELIKTNAINRNVYYISGDVENEERERIKNLLKTETNAIIIASDVFTTGISIKTLNNLVFTSPSKARIKTLQSIGRVLRTTKTKISAVLYDISDDLSIKTHKNYTLKHFIERINLYSEEQFEFQLFSKNLK